MTEINRNSWSICDLVFLIVHRFLEIINQSQRQHMRERERAVTQSMWQRQDNFLACNWKLKLEYSNKNTYVHVGRGLGWWHWMYSGFIFITHIGFTKLCPFIYFPSRDCGMNIKGTISRPRTK